MDFHGIQMFDSHSQYDLICLISFLFVFITSIILGRKWWCIMECFGSFLIGGGLLLIPNEVMNFQIAGGQLDDVHLFLLRQTGAMLIGQAVSLFFSRNSIDGRMLGNVFYSRMLTAVLILLNQAYSAYHLWNRKSLHFNDRHVTIAFSGIGLWVLGSFIQLIRYKEIGGYIQKPSFISAGLIFDHFILLIVSVAMFALPSQMLKIAVKQANFDGVHLCFVRSLAALIIGQALISNAGPGFLYTRDRKLHVIGRLTTQIQIFAVNIFGHFFKDIFTLYHVVPFMGTGFYITILLALLFRVMDEDTRPYVQLKSSPKRRHFNKYNNAKGKKKKS